MFKLKALNLFLLVNCSDCGLVCLPPQCCWSLCWAVPDQAFLGSTSWAPCGTSPDTVLSSWGSLEPLLAAEWGTGGSRLRDRAAGRSTVQEGEHRAERGSSVGRLRRPQASDRDQTLTFPLPAAGSTDTEGRRPLKPHNLATPTQLSGTRTCSPPLWAPAEAAHRWPLDQRAEVHSSFLWCSPGGPAVCRNKARALQPRRACWGDGASVGRSGGWRRRRGRWRTRRKRTSSPNQSAGTTWRTERRSRWCL